MYVRAGYPDVLYMVKPGEENEELKYSLRSLKNLNHGQVFIAGYKPSWVNDRILHIPVDQDGEKYDNVRKNWLAALHDDRLSDDFVLMNDDFFIMQPTKEIPVLRRKKNIEHYIELFEKLNPTSHYVTTMKKSRDLLRSWGVEDIDSYDLHVPMLINKQKMLALFDKESDFGHRRTVYGNYYKLGGERIADVKVINDAQAIPYTQQFLSTIDESFAQGKVGEYIRKKFAKVLVYSHANDPDGLLSVMLAQLAFAEVDYLLTNNPQTEIMNHLSTVNVEDYDLVIVSDIYPGKPVLKALPNAFWFDHKQHSLDKIEEHGLVMPNATITTHLDGRPTSGSELLYRWLREQQLLDDAPSAFVEYIRKIDTWDFA